MKVTIVLESDEAGITKEGILLMLFGATPVRGLADDHKETAILKMSGSPEEILERLTAVVEARKIFNMGTSKRDMA